MDWFYTQPVKILFKTGGLAGLGDELEKNGYNGGILICDPFFIKSGLAGKIQNIAKGRLRAVFSDITPNPLVDEVDACARVIRQGDYDFALAVGGGSAMDLAKAACAVAAHDGSIRAFHSGGKVFSRPGIPLIAVPTTAGTGSEVTCVSVLSDPDSGAKAPISSDFMFAKLIVVDPELTLSVPADVTASTGLDVLSHALEGFWSKNHQPVCDALALHSAKLVFENLLHVFDNVNDLSAREKMCEASVIAGLAFALPKTAAVHACSFPLTSIYRIPHGEACAFTLDSLCDINATAENGRLDAFARALGFSGAMGMGSRIFEMKKYTGMRMTLSDIGLSETDLPEFVKKCHHPNLLNNPVELDDEVLTRMFLSKQ